MNIVSLEGFLQLEPNKPVVWKDIFGNDNPVEVEIGCGKGHYLLARAQQNPGTNFLGFDRAIKYLRRRQKKAASEALGNLQFSRMEAQGFIPNVPNDSVSIFHIYFPDPWPKRRHHSRRLVDAKFLTLLLKKTVPGGSIYLATDDVPYFTQMQESVKLLKGEFESRESHERMIGPIKTAYESKFAAAGLVLNYIEIKKKAKSPSHSWNFLSGILKWISGRGFSGKMKSKESL